MWANQSKYQKLRNAKNSIPSQQKWTETNELKQWTSLWSEIDLYAVGLFNITSNYV